MWFKATDSTSDGRITAGGLYYGAVIYVSNFDPGLRVVVYDNKKEWMSFNPKIFKPGEKASGNT